VGKFQHHGSTKGVTTHQRFFDSPGFEHLGNSVGAPRDTELTGTRAAPVSGKVDRNDPPAFP
jgi:hypothetical protein